MSSHIGRVGSECVCDINNANIVRRAIVIGDVELIPKASPLWPGENLFSDCNGKVVGLHRSTIFLNTCVASCVGVKTSDGDRFMQKCLQGFLRTLQSSI